MDEFDNLSFDQAQPAAAQSDHKRRTSRLTLLPEVTGSTGATIQSSEIRAGEIMSGSVVSDPARSVSVPPAGPHSGMLQLIADAIRDERVDPSKLETLLRIRHEEEQREARREFAAAMVAVASCIEQVGKHGRVKLVRDGKDMGSYKFARMEDVDIALRPLLREFGLRLSFTIEERAQGGGGAIITGTATHRNGVSESSTVPLALDSGAGRNNLQAMGSTISYGKRYVTAALFNIVWKDQDDDANGAFETFIAPDQAGQIRAMLKAQSISEDDFTEYLRVDTLEHLPASRFRNTMASLQKRLARKGSDR